MNKMRETQQNMMSWKRIIEVCINPLEIYEKHSFLS
jgi:hypothetical protein